MLRHSQVVEAAAVSPDLADLEGVAISAHHGTCNVKKVIRNANEQKSVSFNGRLKFKRYKLSKKKPTLYLNIVIFVGR